MCVYVCVCTCVHPSMLLTTSGMIWPLFEWLNKFYSCYMAAVIGIVSVQDLNIDMHHEN